MECVAILRGEYWTDRPRVVETETDRITAGLVTEDQITGDQITNLIMIDVGILMGTIGLIIGLIVAVSKKTGIKMRAKFPSRSKLRSRILR